MAAEFQGFSDFVDMIRGDWVANHRSITQPGFQALMVHRLGSWAMSLPFVLKLLVSPVYVVMYWFVRNFYGIELPRRTRVGRRFCVAHQSGIVVHPFAVIGNDCLIRQNVTIGATTTVKAPCIGDRVEIGAGAVVAGGITIGDDVRIGPNAVVMTNVPPNSAVVAPQPRIFTRPALRPNPEKSLETCTPTK
jgi:serine O-acetyltransferase